MGYQPGLDGLRALSVLAVIGYHAGFPWMRGGFIGVEVFFVVSGFLITTLILDEHARRGRVSLTAFWARRARRLLPALLVVLFAVAAWAAVWGSPAQTSELRRDLPWALTYLANWGQILGDAPYYDPADPPLLRHLWSLAVEEQWYLVWPIVMVFLLRGRLGGWRIATVVASAAVCVMAFTAWVAVDRTNVAYLSTVTRSSGLLLGSAAAFVWRPWRSARAERAPSLPFDLVAGIALGALACVSIAATVASPATYRWILPMSSAAALVVVLAVVHPASTGTRRLLGSAPLAAIGRRSYGLYLWHWPVFVVLGATGGSWTRVGAGLAVTAAVAEPCYRYVESPVRRGALDRWRTGLDARRLAGVATAAVAVASLAVVYVTLEPHDPAVGGDQVAFVVPAEPAGASAGAPVALAAPVDERVDAPPAVPRVVVLGDSQAHSLVVNAPSGLAETVELVNGSIPGCGVHDRGRVLTERPGFDNDFGACAGWQERWSAAAAGADLALVVLGAWDVFDLELGDHVYPFGTPQGDDLFRRNLGSGIDAVLAAGSDVALLEVACMRPVEAGGAAVPALPERGDDERVGHLNDVLRAFAGSYPDGRVAFVEGPEEWCADESIATDLGHRWDGVHVFRPGAALTLAAIVPDLVQLTS